MDGAGVFGFGFGWIFAGRIGTGVIVIDAEVFLGFAELAVS